MSKESGSSEQSLFDTVSRRGFLTTAAATAAVGAGGMAYAQQDYAYRLGGEVAGWNGRAPSSIEGQTNPTLTFQAGQEYTIWWENVDGLPHNIAILDADGNTLESTETITGEGATQTLTFTATEEMAEYYCAVHPNTMRGDVQIETGGTATPTQTPTEEPTETPTEQPTETPTEEPTEMPTEQPTPEPTASATFPDQQTTGESVVVQQTTLSEGGFVTIHDAQLLQQGEALESVIGVSDYLSAGTHTNVEISLYEGVPGNSFDQSMLTEDQTLIAMPHLDTNDNQTYDFVTSGGQQDGPYTEDGQPVVDPANITVC